MAVVAKEPDTKNKSWLEELFQNHEAQQNGHGNFELFEYRKAAFEDLKRTEFPSRRDEDWKYTPVGNIFQERYKEIREIGVNRHIADSFYISGSEYIHLVFVNGLFMESYWDFSRLPEEVSIIPVSKAIREPDVAEWLREISQLKGGTEKNTFLLLNQAFGQNGIVVRVQSNYKLHTPIHVLHINIPEEEAHFTNPQLFIQANTGSEVTVIESFHSTSEDRTYFTNVASRIDLASNARVNHFRIQNEGRKAYQIHNTIVRQARDSFYNSFAADLGGKMVRNNLSSVLTGSGTETNFYGLYNCTGDQHIDNQTYIDHAKPYCQSNELYKGILTDKARGVFNGKVMVRQDAQKTNAFQQNSNLVLSPTAAMDTKPQLEIYADDVRCSHGATIGQLDENWIFYVKSRGIPDTEARNLLQLAFIGEVIEKIENEDIKEYIQHLTVNNLNS